MLQTSAASRVTEGHEWMSAVGTKVGNTVQIDSISLLSEENYNFHNYQNFINCLKCWFFQFPHFDDNFGNLTNH